ncbi:MAG: hypothetical protein K5779_10620 [Saccharofermentans sp.]|nr:hypothetical protein [Saccharofermentans sp.]
MKRYINTIDPVDDYDNLNEIGWNNIIDRHLCAVNDYVRVYKKYGKLNLSTL